MRQAVPQTFRLRSPKDVLLHLVRERSRYEQARANWRAAFNEESMGDHARNFAMFAWHMIEWVLEEVEANRAIATHAATALPDNLNRLRSVVIDACPEIGICGAFAESSKHPERHRAGRWSAADLKVELVRGGLSVPLGSLPFQHMTEREFWIVDGGNKLQKVGQFMDRVCLFWEQFLATYDLKG